MSVKNVAQLVFLQSSRHFSRTSVRAAETGEVAEGYKRLKAIQAKFQKPDGKPVFLKGGPMDSALYYTTVVLCFAGIAGMGKLFYELSYPAKQED
ncbi:cytochrome c oxidase subunit 7A, mitochondrial [Sabethes cyaneus]|uniref:cytochrome c oxidase subunit 7A, mitochondrial n=1 Tax=Sabethes cyaneus TaxID=53552 RepID=UPI00221E35CC|nr:cytochrome c oxidase subunit 7A, mitochondrial [Sabethes cyaneus]